MSIGVFPLIPLPIKEAIYIGKCRKFAILKEIAFPLIPLPIKEAIYPECIGRINQIHEVSINSTSYKRSDQHDPHSYNRIIVTFPLIPLPIKEAICFYT